MLDKVLDLSTLSSTTLGSINTLNNVFCEANTNEARVDVNKMLGTVIYRKLIADKHITNVTFKLADTKHNVYLDDIKIHEIYLESFKHSCYTNLGNKDYRLLMFTAKNFTEMKALAGTDKETLNIVDELEKLNKDKYFGGLYDNEVIQKKLKNTECSI